MKKKGFTLIELLAVIVILAVIALIATPAVLNIIEDSKKSAAEASARNIVSAAKTHYMQNIMDNKKNTSIDLSSNTLKYDGDKATKGVLNYDATGNVTGKMYISGYCVEINNNSITSEKVDEEDCSIDIQTKTYANGEVVYFNVTTGTKCNDYIKSQSDTGVKSGCMKFYAFNDDGTDTINLILDHNTIASVLWNSTGSNDKPLEVLTGLNGDISNWNSTIKSSARLIRADEIAKITGNTNWTDKSNWYYLHDPSETEYLPGIETNEYGWLFDNISSCAAYGCNNETTNTSAQGYWTSTKSPINSTYVWFIDYAGRLNVYNADLADAIGIRPVIEVDKSILK